MRMLRQAEPPAAWTSVRAEFQTAGRGQAGNTWWASAGENLLFSIILFPNLAASEIFWLTQAASVGICAGLSSLSNFTRCLKPLPTGLASPSSVAGLRIKWPNDIYLDGKKIGGMLVQNSWQGQQLQWSIVGLGLNINALNFPASLTASATSLRLAASQQRLNDEETLVGLAAPFDRVLIFKQLLEAVEATYQTYLVPKNFAALATAYHQQLYRLGENHPYRRMENGSTFTARLEGVNEQGLLQLLHPNGQLELFDLKSIAFL